MNRLPGHICKIETEGNLSLITIVIRKDLYLKTIIIETPETVSYLRINNPIDVLFKETEVTIGANKSHAISLQNRIPGPIIAIDKGRLLSRIVLNTSAGEIIAIISTNAVDQMNLKVGDDVIAMIKLNEIMLSQC